MGAALDLAFDSVTDYLDLPEKRVPLNFRVPASLKRDLQAIMDTWQWMAEARADAEAEASKKPDAEAKARDVKDVDLTFVCERLLRIGLEGAWAQMGQRAGLEGMPSSPSEWDRLRKSIVKRAKEEAASKK